MKLNVFFDIRGPGGTITQVPNIHNPVEFGDLSTALKCIAENLPEGNFEGTGLQGVFISGVHIEEAGTTRSMKSD